MPRRVQDIIPADRRSIRDIPVRGRLPVKEKLTSRTKKEAVETVEVLDYDIKETEEVPITKVSKKVAEIKKVEKKEEKFEPEEEPLPINRVETPVRRMPVTPPMAEKRLGRRIPKWPFIVVAIIIAIGATGYFASAYYSQATFTIVPKVIPVTVNSTYVAQSVPKSGELSYEVVTLVNAATTTIAATNGPETSTKATGKVTFYNYSSDKTVRLIAGTRLINDEGLIYRLTSSIVIPAYTKSTSGTATVNPGKIIATLTADVAGSAYNISKTTDPVTLKIAAYKGVPKFETIYAKPVSGILGGFVGVKKIVSPTAVASSTAILKSQITDSLVSQIKSAVPAGYIMYDKSYVVTFGTPVVGGNDPTKATVSLQGTIYGITFPKNKLVETVAGNQTISLFGPFNYTTPGLEDLQVTITNLKDFSAAKKGALVIRAIGNLKIIGTIPVEDIKKKLAGTALSATQDIFKSYSPVIESGSGELAPPWAKIPTDLTRVKVIVQNP